MPASVEGADILLHANRCNKDTTSEGTREGAAIEERDVNGPYISGQWETFINMSVMKPALLTVSWSWTVSAPASPPATLTFTSLSVNVIKAWLNIECWFTFDHYICCNVLKYLGYYCMCYGFKFPTLQYLYFVLQYWFLKSKIYGFGNKHEQLLRWE